MARSLHFPPFRIDQDAQQLWCGENRINLRKKAWDVLCHLLSRPQELVTKEELVRAVWPDVAVTDASLTKAIREVRQALGDDHGSPRFIETVHRRGFRWI